MLPILPYSVNIPEHRVHEDGRVIWCEVTIGKMYEDWTVTRTSVSIAAKITYYFQHEADAVMFKLKFG